MRVQYSVHPQGVGPLPICQGMALAQCAGPTQSATMMYSYTYTLARRAVIATFDLSASHLDALAKDHWLQNPLNVIQLHLQESVVDEV